jgi:hypothetical protein
MKNTYVLGTLGLLFAIAACNNGGSSDQQVMQPNLFQQQPGQFAGRTKDVSGNGAKLDNAHDDIELKNAGAYNPNDYRHVINPNAKPNSTGLGNDGFEFTDASNDRLMESLRARLGGRNRVGSLKDSTVDPLGGQVDDIKSADQAFAQSITMADMRRNADGKLEFHIFSQEQEDPIVLESPVIDGEEASKKVLKMPLTAQDASSEDYKDSLASCVNRGSGKNKDEIDKKNCDVVVVKLIRSSKRETAESYIIFRNVPASITLGAYSNALVDSYQGDRIIDKFSEFVRDHRTMPVSLRDSFDSPIGRAELKSFAVVNGIAAFTLSINRSQLGGGVTRLILSGELATTPKNSSDFLNLPLQRGILSGAEDQPIDSISDSVTDASILHANGRGMMEIKVQLAGGTGNIGNNNNDEGGIIFNRRGANRTNMFRENMKIRFNFATRNKSVRLQEKSNRAIRFTVVPSVSNVIDPQI